MRFKWAFQVCSELISFDASSIFCQLWLTPIKFWGNFWAFNLSRVGIIVVIIFCVHLMGELLRWSSDNNQLASLSASLRNCRLTIIGQVLFVRRFDQSSTMIIIRIVIVIMRKVWICKKYLSSLKSALFALEQTNWMLPAAKQPSRVTIILSDRYRL